MTTRILVLAMGQLSNGEMTISHSCLAGLEQDNFAVRFVSHAAGAAYLRQLGADAVGLDGCDDIANRAAVAAEVVQFAPDLVLCADIYTLEYASTWSGVDAAWVHRLGVPVGTFDEYDWEDGTFTWDAMGGGSSRVNAALVHDCDVLVRPCPLSDPDKPQRGTRPAEQVIHCRLLPQPRPAPMSRHDWLEAMRLPADRKVVFTVNSSWEYVNVSPRPEVARLISWMPRLCEQLLAGLAEPVVVVHVGPHAWTTDSDSLLTYRYHRGLSAELYQATTHHADLFLGTNATSITLSSAVAAGTPSVLLQSPKRIDFDRLGQVLPRMPGWYQDLAGDVGWAAPFRVFPWGWASFLDTVLHPNNPYLGTFEQAPAFLPHRAIRIIDGLLFDSATADAQRHRQAAYFDHLDALPSLGDSLRLVLDL